MVEIANPHFFETIIITLCLFLFLCMLLALAGKFHWSLALLSHFKPQFFAGGLILFVLCLLFGQWLLSALMIVVAVKSFCDLRLCMYSPWLFTPPPLVVAGAPSFRIMQYNKFYKTRPYARLKKYIAANCDIDLIIMQEAEDVDVQPLREIFSATHPYMLPINSERPNYLFIASKHKIENLEIRKLPHCDTKGVRFEIIPSGFEAPIVIYTVHAEMPFGKEAIIQHHELNGMAQWIAVDASQNIICMGDWNTTPYTVPHKNLREKTGLNYQDYGYFPQGTWPSFLLLPIFKIPIDHILFKGNLNLLSLKRGPCFLSDHHSLHAIFNLE